MIALQFALDHPARVRSLTLAAGQVKPPRALMAVQGAVFRLLPAKVLEKQGARIAKIDVVQEGRVRRAKVLQQQPASSDAFSIHTVVLLR